MEISPHEISQQSLYKIMIGAIVPRPIGWISTVDVNGHANLAPFSFFNAVCPNPPLVLFCPMVRGTDRTPKDTLRNVRQTGEFVVNIVTEDLAAAMNLTSTELPPEVDEFEFAGLQMAPSVMVRPPRVALSPVNFECRVHQIIEVGGPSEGGAVVIGEIVYLCVSDDVLIGSDKVDPLKLRAVGRLAGNTFCHVTDLFEMPRPVSQIANPGKA